MNIHVIILWPLLEWNIEYFVEKDEPFTISLMLKIEYFIYSIVILK